MVAEMVADMEVDNDMVVDMEVDKVAYMEVDKVVIKSETYFIFFKICCIVLSNVVKRPINLKRDKNFNDKVLLIPGSNHKRRLLALIRFYDILLS